MQAVENLYNGFKKIILRRILGPVKRCRITMSYITLSKSYLSPLQSNYHRLDDSQTTYTIHGLEANTEKIIIWICSRKAIQEMGEFSQYSRQGGGEQTALEDGVLQSIRLEKNHQGHLGLTWTEAPQKKLYNSRARMFEVQIFILLHFEFQQSTN